MVDENGHATIGFENSAVYQDAADAFNSRERSIVATVPGSVYRYINAGVNVLGAVIRDRIESRDFRITRRCISFSPIGSA